MTTLPTPPPHTAFGGNSPFSAHVAELQAHLAGQRAERESSSRAARAASDAAALATHLRHNGDAEGAHASMREAADSLARSLAGRSEDDEFFSSAAQQLASAQAFDSFLVTGTLGVRSAPRADWQPAAPPAPRQCGEKALRDTADDAAATSGPAYTDEEWLSGLISAAHDIGRYAGVAATLGDVRSVEASRAVVCALHEALQAFDLRNGQLRRSFDSLKYVERRLQDIIYELSLFPPSDSAAAGSTEPAAAAAAAAATAAAAAAEPPAPLIDVAALEAAREAYSALDAAREALIKKCREPQKLAKQSIFALQRGDPAGGARQLAAATKLAAGVLSEDVAAHPSLRQQGCLKGMLEELGEAALFEHWLNGHGLLKRDEAALAGLALSPSEYLGALGDLVGEIGRYAVRKATARDRDAVRASLASAVAVQSAFLSLGSAVPRGSNKKVDTLNLAVKKLETLLYELSLVERSGRVRAEPTSSEPPPAAAGGGGAEED